MMRSATIVRAVFAVVAILALSAGAAPATPVHRVTLVFRPETRQVRVTDALSESDGLSLAPADWIEIEELRVGDRAIGVAATPLALSGPEIAGRVVEVRLAGRLPEAWADPDRFAALPGGAFLFGADGWLPAAVEGEAIFEIAIETPATYRAVATGALLEERVGHDTYTASFRFEGHGKDLAVVFGPYVVGEAFMGDLRLRTYFLPRDAGESGAYLKAVAEHVGRYERLIGDYPFAGFSVVSAPIPVGYGHEAMTYVSERILTHPYMLGRSLAHEVLHSWWGSGVRIDYDRGNWGEGLTTYQADYALAEARGADAARAMRREWLRGLSVLPSALDTPARAFRAGAHGAGQTVGYEVAMIFHMLRRDLGDAVFDAGLRAFWEARRGGTAAWPDLQAAFEGASGQNLDDVFSQWLDRPGLPRLALGAVHVQAEGARHALTVTVQQSDPPYLPNVPIAIETEHGTETRVIRLEATEARARFALDARPRAVQVDPDFQIARSLPRGELPPSFREALWTAGTVVLVPGATSDAQAAAHLGRHLAPDAVAVEPAALGGSKGAVLTIGATAEIVAFRNSILSGEPPATATEGSSRAWVERDDADRLWLFASADDPDGFDDLYGLGYQGALSYAAFEAGAAVSTGTWPADENPLRIALP